MSTSNSLQVHPSFTWNHSYRTPVNPPLPAYACTTEQPTSGRCFPIQGRKSSTCMPSSEIQSENLVPVDSVLNKYQSLRKDHTIGKLAVKLAKESFFGDEVLVKCTVMGCRSFPALPTKELNDLKQTVFSLYPRYWSNPIEFESKIWSQCVNSIGQLCKRLRHCVNSTGYTPQIN